MSRASASWPISSQMQTALFGKPVTISRTGYTGERGYEIFCRGQDAGDDLGPYPGRRRQHGDHPLPLHHARYAADRKLPAVLPLRQFGNVSVRERRPRRYAVGTRPRFHRLARQDRLPRGGGALPSEGQGALQDLGPEAGRQERARQRCAGVQGRQEGRRGDAGDVFAAERLDHCHRPPAGRLRQQRHQAGGELRHPWPDRPTTHSMPFYDVEKKRRTAKG